MKKDKIRVAVLFGGKSAEHEVSIQSAKNVFQSLDKNKYEPILIGIDKHGVWHQLPETYLLSSAFMQKKSLMDGDEVSLISGRNSLVSSSENKSASIDVVFPVLHGTFGEDGTIQGLLKLANIPFVGSGVLGSAIGMDKDVMKRLLRDAGLPIAKFLVFRKGENVSFNEIKSELGLPFFVKPANLGSSVGIAKVKGQKEFEKAIIEAFSYDTKIIIEQYVNCQEIECSVLGNERPIASTPGEIIPKNEFYDYSAKYEENGMQLKIPAELSREKIKEVQDVAIKVFSVLELEGMARIDFFLDKDTGELYVNEANTIPGFTNMSVYPKLWEASGISNQKLVDKLITLAIESHQKQQHLKTSL